MCNFLQINWIGLLKWFIYLLAAITAVLAIVVFVLDQMDTDRALQEREEANSKRNVSNGSSAAKADSQTKNNIILGLLMLSSTAPASFHYCSPRLFFIALMVVLSALTLICRALLAALFRAQYLSTVIVSALAGCLYFYLVAFRAKDPADSSWKTFVQPNSRELGSGAGSSAGEDNVQVIVVRKPKKRKTATRKSSKKSGKIVKEFERRNTIRNTYGGALKEHPQTQLYFVIAKFNEFNWTIELQKEADIYKDIIQFNFVDNYYNLTLKSMSVVRFVAKYCSQAKFFIKMDSDMYLMVDRVVGKLSSLSLEAIYGNYKIKSEVVRNGKYAVDKRDYPEDTYPTYHAGIYFIPANASLLLYRALVTTPHIGIIPALPFEDAYVSGILPERMNIPRKKFSGMTVQPIRLLYGPVPPSYPQVSIEMQITLLHAIAVIIAFAFMVIYRHVGEPAEDEKENGKETSEKTEKATVKRTAQLFKSTKVQLATLSGEAKQ
ncbi:hypothetical protein TYRP_016369 [Tyrophagus putrescentiae]|nr:hypothetical protein TYRP_016369 [Tyrophagus putrescentiae]